MADKPHGIKVMDALNAVCDYRNEHGVIPSVEFEELDGDLGRILDHEGHWDTSIAREIAESTGTAGNIRACFEIAEKYVDHNAPALARMKLMVALRLSLDLLVGEEEAAQLTRQAGGLL